MGLGSRTARRHLTAKAVEAASQAEGTTWDFQPGQRVMTCDGFPGVVANVFDGPFQGNEEYEVTLDGGLGGGAYTASQLRTADGGTTASHEKTAADDYPELGNILVDRPDIAINTVLGSKTAKVCQKCTGEGYSHADDNGEDQVCGRCNGSGQEPDSKTAAEQTREGLAPENGGVGDYSQSDTCPQCGGHRMLHSSDGTVKCENCGYLEVGDRQTGADAASHRAASLQVHAHNDVPLPEQYATDHLYSGHRHVFDDGEHFRTNPGHAVALHDALHGDGHGDHQITRGEWKTSATDGARYRGQAQCSCGEAMTDYGIARHLENAVKDGSQKTSAKTANGDMQEAQQRKHNPFPTYGAACKDCGFAKANAKSGDVCPLCDGQMSRRPEKYASSGYDLLVEAATDPSFRFSITAAWSDVRSKAKRIRSEGGVKIQAVEGGQVVAHVEGDHGTYETLLQHHLGSHQAVSAWNCGCAWAKYAWGRSGEYRRYEGRMCSHALATQFEVLSRKMFGGDLEADDSGARVAALVAQDSPVAFLVQSALASGEEAAEIVLALRTAGITDAQRFVHLAGSGDPSGMSTGEGLGATGDPVSTQGPTTLAQPNDNPASTGWASGPDPADWGQASNFGRMGSVDESIFDPHPETDAGVQTDPDFGAEATLNVGEPEGALPETDGSDPDGDVQGMASHGVSMAGGNELEEPEDGTDDLTPNTTTASVDQIVAEFQATAGRAIMESAPKGGDDGTMNIALAAKQALKDFSPSEQAALINEGASDGVTASNLDRLDIAGTHYEALEAALASMSDDDDLEF